MTDRETLAIRADEPGRLPHAARTEIAGVELPLGMIVTADPDFSRDRAAPEQRAWMSAGHQEDPTELWWRLARAFPETGLWPLVAQTLDDPRTPGRPWSDGELSDPTEPTRSAERFFAETLPAQPPGPNPYGESRYPGGFPGLADALRAESGVVRLPRLQLPPGDILLVPATRPADVLSRLGWLGATNVHPSGDLTAVLRSWEDRFGTVPAVLGFDVLGTISEAVPSAGEQLGRLVAEHYAFCPDNVDQGTDDLEEYGEEIAGSEAWFFWWD
ncbi:MAG: DUF4253 domain-containing protein [Micropruina sp.]